MTDQAVIIKHWLLKIQRAGFHQTHFLQQWDGYGSPGYTLFGSQEMELQFVYWVK